jgi:DNA-binding XRE family transcriptional regulator
MLEVPQSRAAKPKRRRVPNRRLVELRINAGLSPNDLAYRAGVSGNTVRLVEGGFVPSPRVQFAIARVFGLAPLDLWPLEEQRVA